MINIKIEYVSAYCLTMGDSLGLLFATIVPTFYLFYEIMTDCPTTSYAKVINYFRLLVTMTVQVADIILCVGTCVQQYPSTKKDGTN